MNQYTETQVAMAASDRFIFIFLAALVTYVVVATVLTYYVLYRRRATRLDERRIGEYRGEVGKLRRELKMVREIATLSSTRLIALDGELAALKLRLPTNSDHKLAGPVTITANEPANAARKPDMNEPVRTMIHIYRPGEEALADDEVTAKANLIEDDEPDDLTRIWGIGAGNQQRLQENGILYFSQIAAWTSKEVDAFNELLAFRGRIEREHWVEQARDLVAKKRQRAA